MLIGQNSNNEITIITCLFLSSFTLFSIFIPFFLVTAQLLSLHIHFHFHSLSHSSLITFMLPLPLYSTYSHTHTGFFPSLGQRGEPGTGPPSFEQPHGRRLGSQATARPVYRDLCPGHGQYAAQSVPGSLVCSRLPSSPGAATALCDHLPPGGSWGRKDTRCCHWQELASAPQQCHHALYPLQTQGTQWRTVPPEPS